MPIEFPPRPNKNTYWVVPLKFLAGEYPGDKDPVKARKKIKQFLAAGIRHFVDLTEFGELVPYDAILSEETKIPSTKATYQRFPIRDISVSNDSEHLAEILSAIDRRISEGGAVYLHCWGGVGRTSSIRPGSGYGIRLLLLGLQLAKRQPESTSSRRVRFLATVFRVGCFGSFL